MLKLGRDLIVFTTLGVLAAWPARAAPSVKSGAAISVQCAACHGDNGIAVATNIPNLAGQNYVYLLSQLEAYKDGTRKSPIMNEMVASLSGQQMQDIAAYFASIPIRVEPIPVRDVPPAAKK